MAATTPEGSAGIGAVHRAKPKECRRTGTKRLRKVVQVAVHASPNMRRLGGASPASPPTLSRDA